MPSLTAIMKIILIIISFFYQSIAIAQDIVTPKLPKIQACLHIIFNNLEDSSDIFTFRFWNKGQVIDIRIRSDSTKIGEITNFIKQDSSSLEEREIVTNYMQVINLSDSEVQKAINVIEKFKIYNLPTSRSIPGWQSVLDGEWFEIEQRVNAVYSYKYYGNPKSQKNFPEAGIFNNFLSEFSTSLHLDKYFWDFFNQLPVQCYVRNGEHEILCKRKK